MRPGHGHSGGAGALADGVDPDSLIAGGGAAQLREAVECAQGAIEFFAHEVWAKARANSDAHARALADAVRLVAKIANPIRRDLITGTLATGLRVDVAVVRNALARASAAPSATPPAGGSASRPGSPAQPGRAELHPNAPSSLREDAAHATDGAVAPPPTEELELVMLLADHPALIATAEADKAFCLLTDGRLRDMYSAARDGRSLLELAPVRLPPNTAKHVLSGKYALAKDPPSSLTAMRQNLETRKANRDRMEFLKRLVDAGRRHGNGDLSRRLAQRAEATGRGDHELATKLMDEIDELKAGSSTENVIPPLEPETSNRKQVE
jgi:DNA primase